MTIPDEYEVVIGLEVHAQLLTQTKLFCSDTTTFGKEPNTQVSVISLGHPGTLPKMNKAAIELAVRLGIACNCSIVEENFFARKNYFYPDLPKGYQVSQHTTPICINGFLEVEAAGEKTTIRINRIHMEEDAGKSMHDENSEYTNVDFNRAGMPLVEIVTEPDLRSAEQAAAYVTKLRKLARHLQVCDGNMEQGSLRCDVNISVRKKGDDKLGTKVELKNLNSIRFIKKSIEFESASLINKLKSGEKILQQTKGFDEATATTYVIRTKEDEDDYRYFPEPDLPPFMVTEDWINTIKNSMPASQEEVKQQLMDVYTLPAYDAGLLADDDDWLQLFYTIAKENTNYKAAANWVLGPVKNYYTYLDESEEQKAIPANAIAEIIRLIDEGAISYGIAAQEIFPAVLQDPEINVTAYIDEQKLRLQATDETDELIKAALEKHAEKITEYKKGKKGLLSLFVGEVMKQSKGKADAKFVTDKILEILKNQ